MTACCSKRREDGYVDGAAVRHAVDGRATRLSPSEAKIVVWRLSSERRWGPQQIADHIGYSKSGVCLILDQLRANGGRA